MREIGNLSTFNVAFDLRNCPLVMIFQLSTCANDKFRDIELGEKCIEICVEESLLCITECNSDTACISDCMRTEVNCEEGEMPICRFTNTQEL